MLAALLTAVRAEANAGPPIYQGGQIVAEPSGLEGIAITHETLHIDMRWLSLHAAIRNPITVSVAYSIANHGSQREVALIFASGAPDASDFSVTLDGQPIAARREMSVTVPAEWLPPATTPGLEDNHELLYLDPPPEAYSNTAVVSWHHYPESPIRSLAATYAFTVTIPAGESVLAVQYHAEPQQYLGSGYVRTLHSYQFAYVLAPARAWDGFGTLDVTVSLPICWEAASRPALTRSGDVLHGSFDGVPADALALTVAPCELARKLTPQPCASPAPALALGALGIMLCCRTRRPASPAREA